MKKVFSVIMTVALFACNNSKKEDKVIPSDVSTAPPPTSTTVPSAPAADRTSGTNFTIEGKEISTRGSLLVQKDKDKLKPGDDYLVMLTASGGPNNEALTLNFLMALKPGVYPVVGMALHRGSSDQAELYGGILGGKPKLTDYSVNITECKDLGSNSAGGHKWSISGSFNELVIPAMKMMLMNKEKNHPAEIKIEKGNFFNLTFDDNWEELMNKGMEMMKKNK